MARSPSRSGNLAQEALTCWRRLGMTTSPPRPLRSSPPPTGSCSPERMFPQPARGTLKVTVTPNQLGRRLVAHPRYRIVVRLWVSYTPDGGRYHTIGYLGLHLPATCTKH